MAAGVKIGTGIGTAPTHRVTMSTLPHALPLPRSLFFLRTLPSRPLALRLHSPRSTRPLSPRASSDSPPAPGPFVVAFPSTTQRCCA